MAALSGGTSGGNNGGSSGVCSSACSNEFVNGCYAHWQSYATCRAEVDNGLIGACAQGCTNTPEMAALDTSGGSTGGDGDGDGGDGDGDGGNTGSSQECSAACANEFINGCYAHFQDYAPCRAEIDQGQGNLMGVCTQGCTDTAEMAALAQQSSSSNANGRRRKLFEKFSVLQRKEKKRA